MFEAAALKRLIVILMIAFLCAILVYILWLDPTGVLVGDNKDLYQSADAGYRSSNMRTTASIPVPSFSVDSGYFSDAFYLEISVDGPYQIYYTLDSGIPNAESLLYTDPILIRDTSDNANIQLATAGAASDTPLEKETVIRAVAYGTNGLRSEVVTKAYFVDEDGSQNISGLPTVAIITDPGNLFDKTVGIFINDSVRGWEREAYILYFDNTHHIILDQSIGMRSRESSTRMDVNKSFILFARKEYTGSDTLDLPIFNMELHSLLLRFRPNLQTEGFLSSLVADRDVAVQQYEICRLFINGEFWGPYSLLTRIDERYLSSQYGVDAEDIALIKFSSLSSFSVEDKEKEAYQLYVNYEEYFSNTDMSIPENYQKACQFVDMQSLIDCYATQIYINNVDGSHDSNLILWKTKSVSNEPYSDGRWRYGLFDLDLAMFYAVDGKEYAYDFNYFTGDFPFTDGLYRDPVFLSLMNSAAFREQFYQSFLEIAENNFNPERVQALLDALPYQVGNDIISEFFKKRPLYIFTYLDDFMENYQKYAAPAPEKISVSILVLLPIFCVLMIWMVALYRKRYGSQFSRKKGS